MLDRFAHGGASLGPSKRADHVAVWDGSALWIHGGILESVLAAF